jgi:transcriptional regulator with XRE-family HTH domain
MTQRDLAKLADCGEMMISKIERELHEPRLTLLVRVCAALRISMDELCGMSGGASEPPTTEQLETWEKVLG